MTKIMYAKVKLTVQDDTNTECIMGDTVYDFDHPDIINTEWIECEEVFHNNNESNSDAFLTMGLLTTHKLYKEEI